MESKTEYNDGSPSASSGGSAKCPVHAAQGVMHATCKYCRPAYARWWEWERFPICAGRVTEYDPLPLSPNEGDQLEWLDGTRKTKIQMALIAGLAYTEIVRGTHSDDAEEVRAALRLLMEVPSNGANKEN